MSAPGNGLSRRAFALRKEDAMRLITHAIICMVFAFLQRPFLHRLVALVATTLLALSLTATALVLVASRSDLAAASVPVTRSLLVTTVRLFPSLPGEEALGSSEGR
jgi:hypothetical protein